MVPTPQASNPPEDRRLSLVRAVLAVIGALVLIYGVPVIALENVGRPTAEAWSKELTLSNDPSLLSIGFFKFPPALPSNMASSGGSTTSPACKPLTALEHTLLNKAEVELIKCGNFQLKVVERFFLWQYMATLGALVASTLTAMSILVISLAGLPASSSWVKSFFVVCSALAAFWVAVPQLYRYANNQATALKSYSAAISTVWQIRSIRATGVTVEGKPVESGSTLGAILQKASEISSFAVAFDESKAKSPRLDSPVP